MRRFASEIYVAVSEGRLVEPFGPSDVERAVPGWARDTYGTFLPGHRLSNGKTTELFVRVGRGLYNTLPGAG